MPEYKTCLLYTSGTDTAGEWNWETVDLPHTWNGTDGQDGGNDYYRGTCFYRKKLLKNELEAGKEVYLEFTGTNSTADLYVNGKHAAHHDGGYSTWRANITPYLEEEKMCIRDRRRVLRRTVPEVSPYWCNHFHNR